MMPKKNMFHFHSSTISATVFDGTVNRFTNRFVKIEESFVIEHPDETVQIPVPSFMCLCVSILGRFFTHGFEVGLGLCACEDAKVMYAHASVRMDTDSLTWTPREAV